MFCADYAASFVFHALLSVAPSLLLYHPRVVRCGVLDSVDVDAWRDGAVGVACRVMHLTGHNSGAHSIDGVPAAAGALCGAAAAAVLYPFDFVRAGVMQPGARRVVSACATVPYAGTLFGVYFAARDPESVRSQAAWALAASTCAIVAEVPFDYAKRAMFGTRRMVLGAGLLYVPFAATMLVMYDVTARKVLAPHLERARGVIAHA